MTLGFAGLAIITLAWLIQLGTIWRGGSSLRRSFVLLYGIGAALLVAEGTQGGFSGTAWLYLIHLLIVVLLYIKVHK